MALTYRRGWPYLYKSVRRGGRVTSEYVASGESAALIDRMEAIDRQRSNDAREDWKAERERMEAEDRAVAAMFVRVEDLAAAALVAAGFHPHKRQWRRRRG
jgi:hypothetical protein